MLNHFYLFISIFIPFLLSAQPDSLTGFDRLGAIKHASCINTELGRKNAIKASERQFIKQKFFPVKPSFISETLPIQQKSNCDNIGFENNSLAGWKIMGDYKIVSGGSDIFGQFPKVFPGGKYSLQLNDNNINNKVNFNASATRLFQVSSANTFFNLHFAMVILNFPHYSEDAARITITLRDSSNHITLCPNYNCYYERLKGPVGISNFSTSTVPGYNLQNEKYDVTYSRWQSLGIDLSAYMGKNIAVQINCNWCVPRVDWAYCYIDADCNGFVTTHIPCNERVISGPPGLENYKWNTPDGKTITSKSPTLSLQSAGTYTLHCNQSDSCSEFPYMYVYSVLRDTLNIMTYTKTCSLSLTLTILNPVAGETYTWKWGDSLPSTPGITTIRHNYSSPGTYKTVLEIKNSKHCNSSIEMLHSVVAPVKVSALCTDPPGRLYGPDDKKNYVAVSNYLYGSLSYTWTGENYSTVDQYAHFANDGTYIVKAQDQQTGCNDTAIVNVMLTGWIPNIFTPNNDGMNDLFRFRFKKGMVLTVIDRWGNQVHESEDVNSIFSWDGTSKGRDCSDGVFMFVIQPVNRDTGEKSTLGTVTLLR